MDKTHTLADSCSMCNPDVGTSRNPEVKQAPPVGIEPDCLFCWDTGIELSEDERCRRIAELDGMAV